MKKLTVYILQFTEKAQKLLGIQLPTENCQLKTDRRGFTLLLSALIASIVLVLGASIFQIAQKELTLSSIGRDSQFAFYAADTGAECALYWDIRHSYFGLATPPITPMCDEESLTTINS